MAAKTLWSQRTGLITNASVAPGVEPAVPSATLYQAGIVPMWVVLLRFRPQTVVVPGTTMVCCKPRTVAEEAVCADPVSCHVVPEAAVKGVPVEDDSAARLCRPHSVIARVDV